MEPSTRGRETVEELAEEFVERYRRGEHPELSDYTERYPKHATEIRELFPALVLMERIAPESESGVADSAAGPPDFQSIEHPRQLGDYRILREIGRGGMGVVYEAEHLSLSRHVALKALSQSRLQDARQVKRFEREAKAAGSLHHGNVVPVFDVGEEGGLHYYVMQFIQGLGLDDVLDELIRLRLSEAAPTGEPQEAELQVSRRDVSAAAMAQSLMSGEFQHPAGKSDSADAPGRAPCTCGRAEHTCCDTLTLADVGEDGHEHNGPADRSADETRPNRLSDTFTLSPSSLKLADSNHAATKPQSTYWHGVARIGMQAASALEYAHQQGILHRDVKPANLLLDVYGNVWITDFGLASTAEGDNLTRTGDLLGTLRYMAPERFNGQGDVRSDVYSLGLTLYELLTLRPAFGESDRNKLIRQALHDEPAPPRKLNRAVPPDLETVVLKAIARDSAQRYQTPGELAEDLRRFIHDEPIKARRAGWPERIFRWARRNKQLAASLVITALALMAGTGVATRESMRARTALENEAVQRELAKAAESEAKHAIKSAFDKMALRPADPAVRIALARHLLKENRRDEARQQLEMALELDPRNSGAATELAKLVLDRWTVLKPSAMKSSGGSTMTLESDGGVFVSGPNPGRDVYTLEFNIDEPLVSALRLETLPDPRLPHGGAGRYPENGNFNLAELKAAIAPAEGKSPPRRISISWQAADFHQPGDWPLKNALDGDPTTFWDTWPQTNLPHWAIVGFQSPARTENGRLVVTLDTGSTWNRHGLGRFRLSILSDPAAARKERLRIAIEKNQLTGLAALNAVRALEGDASQAADLAAALQQIEDSSVREVVLGIVADEVLHTVLRLRPQDAAVHLEAGKRLLMQGQPYRAREHFETALSLDTQNAAAASELADLILNDHQAHWTVLEPVEMKSEGGATLTLQQDGSVLAGGLNPPDDRYTIRVQPRVGRICALKLETIPDPSLPQGGSGRDQNGSFQLYEITLGVVPAEGATRPIRFRDAVANYARAPSTLAQHATDGNPATCWDPWPRIHQPLCAVFSTGQPVDVAGKTLVIQLVSKAAWPNAALGRFRLSVLGDPGQLEAERHRLEAHKVTDPWERLAIAYHVSNNPTALDKLAAERLEVLAALVRFCSAVDDRKSASAYCARLLQPGDFPSAVVFDLQSQPVTAGNIPFGTYDGFTVEAWVRGWKGEFIQQGVPGDPENSICLRYGSNMTDQIWKNSGWESGQGRNYDFEAPYDGKPGWRHVALTFDGQKRRLFVDGHLLHTDLAPRPGPFLKSRTLNVGGRGTSGLLGSIRISNVVRYFEDFTPSKTLEGDARTELLYDLSLTEDGRLRDRSGKGRHGTIPDTCWVVGADSSGAVLPKVGTPGAAKQ